MKRNTLLIILLFCLNIWSVYSQDYHQRNWYQIETKQYRLIFPDFLLDTALELADFNDSLYEELQYDIDLPLQQQYPLILYPWTLTSNAYVMPLGRHSQWYTKDSPGFFGDRHWLQILSIHEGRHVLQMQLLQQSTSRWLYYLGGEVFSSISAGVTPQWLFEGDAVYNETLFSNSGRGRSGAFVSPMIINFQETEIPSYSAVQFPSRNRINTNAYNFGFLFNQWLREQYGNEIIDELFTHQAELPLPLLGTSRALKKATGLSLNQNYEDFTEDFVENLPPLDSWSDQIKWISSYSDNWTFIDDPLILDHHLVYLKSTAEEENKLYGFLQEEEQDLSMRIDPLTRLSARDNYLIWDQKISFLSRPLDIKSQIVLWNKLTDQKEIITEPGNYICPEIDPQGQRIALLDYTFQGKYALVIMDLRGEELKRFPLDDFVAAHWPSWSKNGEEILLVVQLNQGNQLIKINLNDGTMEPLTSAIPMTIKKPFWYDENPAFILNTSEGQELIQLTPQGPLRLQRGGLGVNGAATDEQGDLYLVGFNSSQGEQLGYWEDPIWENISWDQEIQRYISLFPAHRELENVDENSINLTREVVPYKGDYFQPYGWGFYSLSGELPWGPVIPFSLMSKDPLGTNQWEMSLLYNQDLKQTSLRFWGQYFMGIIPLELQLEQEIPWKQWGDEVSQGTMGIEFPLGFDRASFYLHAPLDLGLQAIYSNSDTSSEDLSIQFQSDLNFQMGQTGSVRDIGDSWENNIYLFCSLPLNNTSQQLYGVSTMTGFTGPWKHHIQLEYGYQLNQSDLSSLLKFPRGWEAQDFKSQQTWSINYQIPLAYPEAELTRLLFVSRLRVQFFYDGLYNQEDLYNSVGTEFIMDFYPLQIPLEFSGGIRLSFLLEEQIPKVDIFLLNVAY